MIEQIDGKGVKEGDFIICMNDCKCMEEETDQQNGGSIFSEDTFLEILGYYDEMSEDYCMEKEVDKCHGSGCQNENDYTDQAYSSEEQETSSYELDLYIVNVDIDYAEYNYTDRMLQNGPDERMNLNGDLNINELHLAQERQQCTQLACLYDDSEADCELGTDKSTNQLPVNTLSLESQLAQNEPDESLHGQPDGFAECTNTERDLERICADMQGMSEKEAELRSQVIEIFSTTPKIDENSFFFDRMRINRICIDSKIFVSIDERECKVAERVASDECIIKRDGRRCADGHMCGMSEEEVLACEPSTDAAIKEEVMKTFKEMEKRALEADARCIGASGGMPRQKFVIDQEEVFLKIEEVIKLNDLKHRNLIGKIHKKGRNSRYQSNWFTLRKNFFTCYSRKGWRMVPGALLENDGNLKDPEQDMFFLKRKYTLDLLYTKIYLLNKKKWYGCIRANPWAEEELIDITEDTKIMKIIPMKKYFVVVLKKNLVKTQIRMKELSFMLKSGDATHIYKSKCIDTFLGWIVAFAFRQGRITCNIG